MKMLSIWFFFVAGGVFLSVGVPSALAVTPEEEQAVRDCVFALPGTDTLSGQARLDAVDACGTPAGYGPYLKAPPTSPTPLSSEVVAQPASNARTTSNFEGVGLVPCGGPDDPFGCDLCQLGQLMQNIINFLIGLSVSVAAAMFAYAGFLYTTGRGNPTQIGRAHKIFQNVLIGFFIAVSAWLVVQTFLSVVFDKKFWVGGNWNELRCISESSPIAGENKRLIGTSLRDVFNTVIPQGSAEHFLQTFGTYTVGGQGELSQDLYAVTGRFGEQCSTGFCSPQVLRSLGYTTEQANVMSCIAVTESGGDPYAYNRGENNESSACGLFQIQERTHWGNPDVNSGACSTASCTNSACNIQVAYNLSQRRLSAGQSPYGDWTCPGCNNKAVSCVQQYDPTGYNRWY